MSIKSIRLVDIFPSKNNLMKKKEFIKAISSFYYVSFLKQICSNLLLRTDAVVLCQPRYKLPVMDRVRTIMSAQFK